MNMKTISNIGMAALVAVVLSVCAGAAFNRVDLTMNRNITVGQELMDLQDAHKKGVINDTEYAQAKKDILNMVTQFGELKDD
jgi:hypothetical protein